MSDKESTWDERQLEFERLLSEAIVLHLRRKLFHAPTDTEAGRTEFWPPIHKVKLLMGDLKALERNRKERELRDTFFKRVQRETRDFATRRKVIAKKLAHCELDLDVWVSYAGFHIALTYSHGEWDIVVKPCTVE